MNIQINEPLIKRNTLISRIAVFGGLLVLAAGMFISIRLPEQVGLSMGALLLGFLLSQVGIYYTNRWGRHPRPYELINQALKGLDGKYSIYHYSTPASHLLVGPAGVWVLLPRPQRGTITFSKGRWIQKGGNLYLKIFAQEGLGRPELEIAAEVDSVRKYLLKRMDEDQIPPVQAALVFTNDRAVLQVDEAENPPAATLSLKQLKEFIRKSAKSKPISLDRVVQIQEALA